MNSSAVWFSTIMMIVVLSSCGQTNWVSERYRQTEGNIDTVSIVFPQFEYYYRYGDVDKPSIGKGINLDFLTATSIREILDEGRSFARYSIPAFDSLLVENWVQEHYKDAAVKYKALHDSLVTKIKGDGKFPYRSEIIPMNKRITTRYFLFITGLGFTSSEKTIHHDAEQLSAFKLFFDSPFDYSYQWHGTFIHIVLVDSWTNEILWSNVNKYNDSNYHPFKRDDMKKLLRKLME